MIGCFLIVSDMLFMVILDPRNELKLIRHSVGNREAVSSKSVIQLIIGVIEETVLDERSLTQSTSWLILRIVQAPNALALASSIFVLKSNFTMEYPYFAYGSNMNLRQMSRRCPGAEFCLHGELQGWRYFINGNGYAGIEESTYGVVLGCIWTLKPENWLALDRYEGVEQGCYDKKLLMIKAEGKEEPLEVLTYISNDYNYGRPSTSYHEIVLEGANDVGLPESYILTIENWRNGPPEGFL
jgi:gamma-glutamylcyclotransferase (GGCT)/AIG2-like uncharacterized protein YtfP